MSGNMYADAKTWSPFRGCRFDCTYCKPSFKAQAKRQVRNCLACADFTPHTHPERLDRIPGGAGIVFACANGDIAFCPSDFICEIIASIIKRNERYPECTYYLQSKMPGVFNPLIPNLPSNVVLVTTLETNRDKGYGLISRAPVPTDRWVQFRNLDWPRKVITIEPVMDFDHAHFVEMIMAVNPEYVWLGFNSHPKAVQLPEPSESKLGEFIKVLQAYGVEVRGKILRGVGARCGRCGQEIPPGVPV